MSDFFTKAWIRVSTQLAREEGQAVTEYAVVLAVVALIAVAVLASGVDTTIVDKLKAAVTSIGLTK